MLAKLLPIHPAQRHLALRFAWILGSLAVALLIAVLATAGTWPGAIATAEKAGKKVKLEHLVQVWVWRALVVDLVLAALLLLTVRWWVGVQRVASGMVKPTRRYWLIAGGILLLATGLRVPRLDLSFYNDEAHNFVRMTTGYLKHKSPASDAFTYDDVTWLETLFYNKPGNNAQPHSLLSRLSYDTWKALAHGADGEVCEWAARIPALLCGLASLLVLGLAVRETTGHDDAALLTMLAGAVHPWHLRYSSEARGYAILLLGVVLAALFLHRALKHSRWRDWVGYALANFLCLWSFYGAVHFLAALNACLIVKLILDLRAGRGDCQALVRFTISGVFAVMVALPLMLPLIVQLLEALKTIPGMGGTMTSAWWQDIGSSLLFGCRWLDAAPTSPISMALSRWTTQLPWLWLPMASTALIVLAGLWKYIARGGASAVLGSATLLSVLLAWGDLWRQGKFLNHWYLLYVLPVVLMALAEGVRWLGSLFKGASRVLTCALLLAALALPCAVSWHYQDKGKCDERGPVIAVRGSVYPHFMDAELARKPLLGVLWSDAAIYDPTAVVIGDAATLDTLVRRAAVEERPLFVCLAHPGSARADQPQSVARLESAEFERVASFPSTEESDFTQFLYRLR